MEFTPEQIAELQKLMEQFTTPASLLGEDQRTNLANLLRNGVPEVIRSTPPRGDLTTAKNLGEAGSKLYGNLQAEGDGSTWEGFKNKLSVGNPNIYADNYQAEFGQYDPKFQVTNAPVAPNAQGGMFGGLGKQMSGWFK